MRTIVVHAVTETGSNQRFWRYALHARKGDGFERIWFTDEGGLRPQATPDGELTGWQLAYQYTIRDSDLEAS